MNRSLGHRGRQTYDYCQQRPGPSERTHRGSGDVLGTPHFKLGADVPLLTATLVAQSGRITAIGNW
jgi:hypothetical protein